jgi:putative ABC transport system substrate-binding protein
MRIRGQERVCDGMIRMRAVLATALGLYILGAATPLAEAQRTPKIPQLCFLTFDPGTAQSPSPRFAGFFQGLRELGYVHGQTITIDYLSASDRGAQFLALASECVRLKPDGL